MTRSLQKQEKAVPYVIVRCIGCNEERAIGPNEIPADEVPSCWRCGNPMIAKSARLAAARRRRSR